MASIAELRNFHGRIRPCGVKPSIKQRLPKRGVLDGDLLARDFLHNVPVENTTYFKDFNRNNIVYYGYGPAIIDNFVQHNNLRSIVRSGPTHMHNNDIYRNGYTRFNDNDSLISLTSSPQFSRFVSGSREAKGAVMHFNGEDVTFHTFSARKLRSASSANDS